MTDDKCGMNVENFVRLIPHTMEKKENIIKDKTCSFALSVVSLYKQLTNEKKEYVLSKQFLRSGTSIGANVREADAAISRADFSAKISIAYKEAM